MSWKPSLGAWLDQGETQFRVWAPEASTLHVVEVEAGRQLGESPLSKCEDGTFCGRVLGLGPGDCYQYRIDGKGPYPDPASRFQPEGVHGPSQIVDPSGFRWSDQNWRGVEPEGLVFYELHVGTFTEAGTFRGARERLPELRDLGVTAIELMPAADFPGERGWGYDGVCLFAPARCYGRPDDVRRFVNTAHQLGLAVFLDVVYNHLGPDGNYLEAFSAYYFSQRHHTPWGSAINFDGEQSQPVRRFFIENALYWIHEYHFDGLRLDATHAILDDSPRHILAELSARVHDSMAGSQRRAVVIAEDNRNLAHMVKPEEQGGWGLDALWSDDFHHQIRRALAGDRDGYFIDFNGSPEDIATTVRKGWFYHGQHAPFFGGPRGSDPEGLEPTKFVFFIQNHDQAGNRALGDRLHHGIDLAAYRAATVLWLGCPQIPLLFMGQEWAASTPFQYFTDHKPDLGKLVTEGRRREFQGFEGFSDPAARERIPDPQDIQTFLNSRLRWAEREETEHASTLRLYKAMLALRRQEPALQSPGDFDVRALSDDALAVRRAARRDEEGAKGRSARLASAVLVIVQLRGGGELRSEGHPLAACPEGCRWEVALHSEDPSFAPDPAPPEIELSSEGWRVHCKRPTAVVLRAVPEGSN